MVDCVYKLLTEDLYLTHAAITSHTHTLTSPPHISKVEGGPVARETV